MSASERAMSWTVFSRSKRVQSHAIRPRAYATDCSVSHCRVCKERIAEPASRESTCTAFDLLIQRCFRLLPKTARSLPIRRHRMLDMILLCCRAFAAATSEYTALGGYCGSLSANVGDRGEIKPPTRGTAPAASQTSSCSMAQVPFPLLCTLDQVIWSEIACVYIRSSRLLHVCEV